MSLRREMSVAARTLPMDPRRNRLLPALIALLLVVSTVSILSAGTTASSHAREDTYPEGVENITQDPWDVKRGEDIEVTVTFTDDAAVPERVSLIWCRVEPDYVCAAVPPQLKPSGDHTWTGTIDADVGGERSVVTEDTRHIGYNLSIQYASDDPHGPNTRVHAPTHNTWAPDTFSPGTAGHYYFVPLGEPTEEAPAAPVIVFLLLLLVSLVRLRPRLDGQGGR